PAADTARALATLPPPTRSRPAPPPSGPPTAAPPSPCAGVPAEFYDFLAPAQAPDELGRLGPYRVLRVLGAGGMGVVFQAEDPQLGRHVALKVLRAPRTAGAADRERFLREARATAALEHEHIVAIHQVCEEHGTPYFAMQLL